MLKLLQQKLNTVFDDFLIDLAISISLLLLFGLLFFYNLGGTSLVDFDEAWFAQIARNILVNKQPLVLSFNESIFADHPPFGFILMAFSFLIFGVSEFAARFPSAVLGVGSVLLTYFIGKRLFDRTVGLGASLMLVSSVWFVLRSRMADLDTIFLFFFLLTFYFSLNIKINKFWVFPFAAALASAILTKSAIGMSIIIPSVLYLIVNRIKIPFSFTVKAFLLFFAIIAPWVIGNILAVGLEFPYYVYQLGTRSGNRFIPNILDLLSSLTVQYLHFGVREWFYPAVIAFFGSFAFIHSKKELIPIYGLIIFLLVAFLTNKKTEIWHLIPLYPFFGFLIAFFLYQLVLPVNEFLNKFSLFDKSLIKKFLPVFVILPLFLLTVKQIAEFVDEINLYDKHVSGLAYTAKAASGRSEPLYLDNDNFLPSAVFYSNKKVHYTKVEKPPQNSLRGLVEFAPKPILILTEKYRLQIDNIPGNKYEVLSERDGHVLIIVN